MSDVELAWAAGVFESEGCVSHVTKSGKVRVRAAITQNGGEEAKHFLLRFVRAVGRGGVLGPYDYSYSGLGSKPRYVVQYQTDDNVEYLIRQLRPYLTPGSPKLEKYERLTALRQGQS